MQKDWNRACRVVRCWSRKDAVRLLGAASLSPVPSVQGTLLQFGTVIMVSNTAFAYMAYVLFGDNMLEFHTWDQVTLPRPLMQCGTSLMQCGTPP